MKTKFLAFVVCILILAGNISCSRPLPERPNILFIMTDYQSAQDIPAETEILKMDHLKMLSEEGIVFKNHISNAPICMPSRSTVITGQYPHTHGIWDNIGKWVPEDSDILMEELADLGYHTAGIGKMHFTPFDRMAGFKERITADRKGNSARDTMMMDDYALYLKKAGYNRWDYLKLQDQGDIFGLYEWPLADSLHIDYFVGEKSAKYLDTLKTDKPWFAWVSFNGPHNPWDPPKIYSDYYLDEKLPKAQIKGGELSENPVDITMTRYNYTRKVVDQLDKNPDKQKEYIRRIRASHYGNLTFIDEQVGKIIEVLEKNKELDNTIIIWTADHGSHLGDHNLIHKGTHYDRSARVPFVVWWGKNIEPGIRNDFSSHVDLMSTFIDLAGGQPPSSQEGHTLRKMISGESEGDDYAIVEIFENYSLVTHDYIYGVFPNSKEKVLVDRRKDPNAHNNLISDKYSSKTADSLQNVLYDFRPQIEEEFQRGTPLPDLPNAISIEQGKTYPKEAPYLGGKPLKITGSFTHAKGEEGPLVVFHDGNTHGLSLYIEHDELYCGIRTWYDDQIEPINSQNLIGKNKFELKLESSGRVSVVLNGSPVTEFQSSWPMPVQPGKKQYLIGTWSIGKTASRWFRPIGNYQKDNTYPGIINPVQIQTLN